MSIAFNKRKRIRSFQIGEKVLVISKPIIVTWKIGHKFTSKMDGPYMVQEVYLGGAHKLVDENSVRVSPINGKFLKIYHP